MYTSLILALLFGVDVSNYDANHDFGKSGAAFGIAKATEGTGHDDRSFARHWREMSEKKIVRGAYHYGHPKNDPIAEADHFLKVVQAQGLGKGDLLALDLETTDGRSEEQVNTWARRWLEHVEAKTGVKALFYSSWSFAGQYGDGLQDYPLWVAHYGKKKGTVEPPGDWKEWTIHQYASGKGGDENVSRLNAEQLRALGYQG
ncbi:glycoside hydrolase family 25 protein [Nonomuraea sp. NPDC050556]|uniref:glycoside hydrolase family 25 protein n=1 Tax=Nonomuraea sp. NPDC050556 TaxID=3364369 RepID=UPI0037A09914